MVFAEGLAEEVKRAQVREDELEDLRTKAKEGKALAVKDGPKATKHRMAKVEVQAPYDKPESILKREVYRFTMRYLTDQNSGRLEDVLEANIPIERTLRVKFSENPFHRMLLALRSEGLDIEPFEITRYSSQLLYAQRHDIDPDLLIGFLYQTGSPDEIRKRVMRQKYWEPWYLARLNSTN